jgi:hypothetical protein
MVQGEDGGPLLPAGNNTFYVAREEGGAHPSTRAYGIQSPIGWRIRGKLKELYEGERIRGSIGIIAVMQVMQVIQPEQRLYTSFFLPSHLR